MSSSSLGGGAAQLPGQLKHSFQTVDHGNGWILLDGRLRSTLTASQITEATAQGMGVNIPNGRGRVCRQKGALWSTGGVINPAVTLVNANLPQMRARIQTNTSPNTHNHVLTNSNNLRRRTGTPRKNDTPTRTVSLGPATPVVNAGGAHTHDYTLRIGQAAPVAIALADQFISANHFIWLGP